MKKIAALAVLLLCAVVPKSQAGGCYPYRYSYSYPTSTYCAPVTTYVEPVKEYAHAVTAYNPYFIERIYGIPTYNAVYRASAIIVDGKGGVNVGMNGASGNGESGSEVTPAWAKDLVAGMKTLNESQISFDRRLQVLENTVLNGGNPQRPVPSPPKPKPGNGNEPNPFPREQSRDPNAKIKPIGKLNAPSCVKCHEASFAKEEGGGFVMFKGPDLVDLSEVQIGEVIRRVLLPTDHKHRMPKGKPFTPEQKVKFLEDFGKAMGLETEEDNSSSTRQPMNRQQDSPSTIIRQKE